MSAFTDFLDSDSFVALVTLAVGFVAIYIYRKQQVDQKKDAASIILMEIKNAESQLMQAKETIIRDKVLPETTFAMRSAHWNTYSYMFVRDFTDKEWDQINTFYEKCRLYDEAVDYNNTFFKKNEEQIRINLHQALAEYTKKYVNEYDQAFNANEDDKEIDTVRLLAKDDYAGAARLFADEFMANVTEEQNGYFYKPNKAFTDGEKIIRTIRLDLSTSTLGAKLEDIINSNFRSRLFKRLSGK